MTKTKATAKRIADQDGESHIVVLVDPKARLQSAADVMAELLPTFTGPGRRHLEAALANLIQAIRFMP